MCRTECSHDQSGLSSKLKCRNSVFRTCRWQSSKLGKSFSPKVTASLSRNQVALYLGRAEPPLPSICVSALDCTNLFEHVKIENKEMLPTNNYFKHTTRLVLNQREKQEIIDATERAVMHVLSMDEFRSVCQGDIPSRLQELRERMAYLRQAIHLAKGSVQPRYSMGDRDVSRSQRKRKQLRRKRESNYTLFSIDFWI
jgi:hypothetical protein